MNKQEFIVVVCRLIALWMVINALSLLIFVLTQNVDFLTVHSDEGPSPYPYVMATIINFFVNFFIAYGLWMYSPHISYRILPQSDQISENYPKLADWLAILYALMGLFWFVNIFPEILSFTHAIIISTFLDQGFSNTSLNTVKNMFFGPMTLLIQLFIAIFLIIKARWFAGKVIKFNGLHQVDEQCH